MVRFTISLLTFKANLSEPYKRPLVVDFLKIYEEGNVLYAPLRRSNRCAE